ncbi:hypothetical protein F4604DRAFT_1691203 [Suillus subluteus]|nr:hypothetical protein F4604DRAFT_1691203 [Suillus subluteus]
MWGFSGMAYTCLKQAGHPKTVETVASLMYLGSQVPMVRFKRIEVSVQVIVALDYEIKDGYPDFSYVKHPTAKVSIAKCQDTGVQFKTGTNSHSFNGVKSCGHKGLRAVGTYHAMTVEAVEVWRDVKDLGLGLYVGMGAGWRVVVACARVWAINKRTGFIGQEEVDDWARRTGEFKVGRDPHPVGLWTWTRILQSSNSSTCNNRYDVGVHFRGLKSPLNVDIYHICVEDSKAGNIEMMSYPHKTQKILPGQSGMLFDDEQGDLLYKFHW